MNHKLLLLASIALLLATIPVVTAESMAVQQLFEQFKAEHGRFYADPKEEAHRLGVFQVILQFIFLFKSGFGIFYCLTRAY